jgi:hypothetical protein
MGDAVLQRSENPLEVAEEAFQEVRGGGPINGASASGPNTVSRYSSGRYWSA